MKERFTFTIILLLGFSCILCGLPSQYQNPNIIGTRQGLSSTKVNSIIQDQKGFVWIGTENGLNKFDGYRFTIYKKIWY